MVVSQPEAEGAMGVVQDAHQASGVRKEMPLETIEVAVRLLDTSGIEDPQKTNVRIIEISTQTSVEDMITLINDGFGINALAHQLYLADIYLNIYDQKVPVTEVYWLTSKSEQMEVTVGQLVSKEAAPAEEEMSIGASASPTETYKMNWYDRDSTEQRDTPETKETYGPPIAIEYQPRSYNRQETGFVGLVNQAMTCYLNSLLQALFMTPEFRNALYRWEFTGSDDEASKNIPFQLQKLFLQLQTTSRSAVETTSLTQSFGWDSSEAWQQQDIQELCRVMFDALEQCFKNTDQSDLISNLYEGKMKDYVKCLACGTENAREDTFLDIPLPIKPFGSDEAFHSLEEALRAFVEPEMLTDNNKYECSKCDCLCDAHKGLKFTRFPYLLTVHLKRFDFDYQSFLRIKLNDKVTFPKDLNLNGLIGETSAEEQSDSKVEVSIVTAEKTDDTSTTDSGAGLDTEDGSNGALTPPHQDLREDDEGIDLGASGPEKQKEIPGPYTYELFSIMVHSGSASGGHYYAYIKDFKTNNWFCFNDQSVSAITYDDIRRTYGGNGSRSFYSSSSANAYMLIYRQSNDVRNCNFFPADEFPTHIKKLVKKIDDGEVAERQAREIAMNMLRVLIFSGHVTKGAPEQKEIKIHKDETLATLTKQAWEELELSNLIPLERCRLVSYEPLYDNIKCAFDDREHESISSIMSVESFRKRCFYLETREENESFEDYKDGGTSIKVYQIDLTTEEVEGPFTVRVNLDNHVIQFRDLVAKTLGFDTEKMRIAKEERCPKVVKPLDLSTISLKREDITRSTKIYVEGSGSESTTPFKDSLMYKVIDRFEHTKVVIVQLPDTSKETLESLQISPYVEEVAEIRSPTPISAATSNESTIKNVVDSKSTVSIVTPETNSSLSIVSSPSTDTSTKVVSSCQSKPICHTQSVTSKSPVPSIQTVANLSDNEDDTGVDCEANLSVVNSDQSASEDSSLTSDSDRTLVGDPPEDKVSQGSRSPDYHSVSSMEDEAKEETGACSWDYSTIRCNYMDTTTDEEMSRYFKLRKIENEKYLYIAVDNRMTVRQFRRELQPYVGVSQEHFKLYTRIYDLPQTMECAQPRETLVALDSNFTIALSRALQRGEHMVKVYVLDTECSEDPAKFLLEVIISEGESVLHVKEKLVEKLDDMYDMFVSTVTLRLRKKCWKNPQTIFFDEQLFAKDIPFSQMNELYIQEMEVPEIKSNREDELCLYAKRWRPSTYTTDRLKEFIVPDGTIDSLKEQLSKLSGIEKENVMFARGRSTFPCDMSVIDIESDLDWKQRVGALEQEPLFIMDDGCVIYYKDKTEEVKQLTEDERRELSSTEIVRLHPYLACTVPRVPKKSRERGLKIYLNQS